ncbi:PREDICTED: arrestin homolog [Ceratosolen solmsi marchali]|uniref:Arrestin homolog n=1 Tax=Ceratosolen solmsi marchali TaxID=326594 RepID=A0AAJ6YY44_9HYME|nr:PREDICTED: arrestin homolog [Ceratosolen solmsi marchali]
MNADIVQHVDVCMFSNGKFKNVVAQICSREGCPVEPGLSLSRTFILKPEKGSTKNWIALEDDPGYARASANLASTVVSSSNSPEDRNVFAIYVSYYVKVKIVVSPIGEWIGGVVSLKLPFTLAHNDRDLNYCDSPTLGHIMPSRILDKIETVDDPNEDTLPFIDKDNTSDEDQDESPGKNIERNTTNISDIGVLVPTTLASKQTKRRDSISNADLIEQQLSEEEVESST